MLLAMDHEFPVVLYFYKQGVKIVGIDRSFPGLKVG